MNEELLRLELYQKRKKHLLENVELDLKVIDNKIRFVDAVCAGEINIFLRKRLDLVLEIKQKNFDPLTKGKKKDEQAAAGATEEKGVSASEYDYLLLMTCCNFTVDGQEKLMAQKAKLETDLEELRQTSPRSLWPRDHDSFEKEVDLLDKMDVRDARKGVAHSAAMETESTEELQNGNKRTMDMSKVATPSLVPLVVVYSSSDEDDDGTGMQDVQTRAESYCGRRRIR